MALLVPVAVPSLAAAQTRCPAARGMEGAASFDGEERLKFLDAALRKASRRHGAWTWAWVAAYSGLATYNILWATVNANEEKKIDGAVGAFGSLVGLAVIAVMPPKAIADQWRLARLMRDKGPVCALVAEGERMLARDADGEEFGHSALVHTGTIAFNAVLGGLLAGVWHHMDQAAITSMVGTAIGELQILTSPTTASKALERYKSGDLSLGPQKRAPAVGVVPHVSREGASIGFTLAF